MASRSAAPGAERTRDRTPAEGRRPARTAEGYARWSGEFRREGAPRDADARREARVRSAEPRSAEGRSSHAAEARSAETRSARSAEPRPARSAFSESWLDLIPEDMLAPAEEPVRRRVPRPAPPREEVREESTAATGRRTVTIRGQAAPPSRPAGTTLTVPRRPPPRAYERVGARPDRVAMYAVILGVLLVLAAVLSVHG